MKLRKGKGPRLSKGEGPFIEFRPMKFAQLYEEREVDGRIWMFMGGEGGWQLSPQYRPEPGEDPNEAPPPELRKRPIVETCKLAHKGMFK